MLAGRPRITGCSLKRWYTVTAPGLRGETRQSGLEISESSIACPWAVQAGVKPVIPPKSNRTEQREYDQGRYKARHLIESFFAKLKHDRALATRYGKRAVNFLDAVYLAFWHMAQLMTRPRTTYK